jgi:tRNA A-37 threonylcarbamoyl transferase component Bud32
MHDKDLIAELLLKWEEQFEMGKEVSAEELCRACPELAPALGSCIESLKITAWMNAPDSSDHRSSSMQTIWTIAGRYRLDGKLAEGGFAEVWRGYDLELRRAVAVKAPRQGQRLSIDRFIAEARKVAGLKHPGVVPVFDVLREGDSCFIIGELVEGGSLADRIAIEYPAVPVAARWIAEIAETLAYAHRLGFIHRDIKPANILIDHHGRALLADFGIAQSPGEGENQCESLGTLAYMSPEQVEGKPIDQRSDIYSLGVVLYELLAQRPLRDPRDAVPGRDIVPQEIGSSVELCIICKKCLEYDPARRYPDADSLAADLHRALSKKRTTKRWAVIACVALFPIIVIGIVAPRYYSRLTPKMVPHQIKQFDGMEQVLALDFTPDGRFLLTGDIRSGLQLWNIQTGETVRRLVGHTNWIRGVAVSPNGQFALSGSGGTEIDGKLVVGSDTTIRLWDLESGTEVRKFPGHREPIPALAFSPDGSQFLSGSDDHTVRLWDVSTGAEIRRLSGHDHQVRSVTFCSGGHLAASAGSDGTMRLWDLDRGAEVNKFHAHQGSVEVVVCSPNGHWLATGGKDNLIRIWDLAALRELRQLTGHGFYVTALRFSPDNHRIVSGSLDGTVRIWDVASGRELYQLLGHRSGVTSLALSADGKLAASGGEDGTARVWSLPKQP